ncbi:hypothetical protein IAR55_004429 [Kwoniella newhampshirensis]|uniref:Uncharacterized protein n=1 Tax=Kwoniella newhampshirensis TaxID=1651941 RepID=A0AAW0YPH5_9TREE
MAASERTPLLPSSRPSGPLHSAEPSFTLHAQSTFLLDHFNSFATSTTASAFTSPSALAQPYTPSTSHANLAVHLYALHLLEPKALTPSSSIRAQLAHSEVIGRVRTSLYDAIEEMLDSGLDVSRPEEGTAEREEEEEGEEDLHEILWDRWAVDETGKKWASALDLMLPPYTPSSTTSPLLSHPVIRHILDRTWTRGAVPSHAHDPGSQSCATRFKAGLQHAVTPRWLHAAHFTSFVILFGSTLAIAISPQHWVTPYDPEESRHRPTIIEIIWMIWAGSDLLHTIQYPTTTLRRLLLVPTHLAFIFSFFPSFELSFTLLTVSIPTLTFLLVLPDPPSLPILIKPLLPLSILLRRILYRSLRTAGLLMPLVLVLLGIFSWSMNGDIFRGFDVTSQLDEDATSILWNVDRYPSSDRIPCRPVGGTEAGPVEVGIAPFETRLMLFLTLTLSLVFSIILTAARAISPPRERWDAEGERRWRGAVKEGDDWEREYGVVVGRKTRRAWAIAVRSYVWKSDRLVGSSDAEGRRSDESENGSGAERPSNGYVGIAPDGRSRCESYRLSVPLPLNILQVPYDVYQGLTRAIRWVSNR